VIETCEIVVVRVTVDVVDLPQMRGCMSPHFRLDSTVDTGDYTPANVQYQWVGRVCTLSRNGLFDSDPDRTQPSWRISTRFPDTVFLTVDIDDTPSADNSTGITITLPGFPSELADRILEDVAGIPDVDNCCDDCCDDCCDGSCDDTPVIVPPLPNMFISEMDWLNATCGWDGFEVQRNSNVSGTTLLNNGFGTHTFADSNVGADVDIDISQLPHTRFEAWVSMDDEMRAIIINDGVADQYGRFIFEVLVDDVIVAQTGILTAHDAAFLLTADITGGTLLTLRVRSAINNNWYGHANWSDVVIRQ
jgi:hypothetical protein